MGDLVGLAVGGEVGKEVGSGVGTDVGAKVGTGVGRGVGAKVGNAVGTGVGANVGARVGESVKLVPNTSSKLYPDTVSLRSRKVKIKNGIKQNIVFLDGIIVDFHH